ncbi:MAG: site-specific DNA-methyltransferase [Patescibacteria group bacterium]|nr:site-specific DNA-methyltransferase [Patescibacteria group bacterium]MDE2438127.1 site-specific DNA-methyltransferase [Patescibacteria group bacterium]
MKLEDVARLMNGEKVSLLLTDPPYGVGYVEGKREFLASIHKGNNDTQFSVIAGDTPEDDYYDFSSKWLKAIQPYLAPKNSFYIFNGDTKLRELLNALHDTGYTKSALLVWLKNHFIISRKDYHPQHELIVYGWHGTHSFFGNKDKTALFYPKPNSSRLHPTMKPPALLRRLIYHSTRPGDIVVDPFGGSGSTLVASEHLGRRCFMIEREEAYCKTIIDRWQKLTKQKVEPLV